MNDAQVEKAVEKWVAEALELRFGVAGDPRGALPAHPGNHPDEIVDTLIRLRQRADRVDEIVSQVRRLKGRLSRNLSDTQLEAEIKRDEAYQKNRATRVAEYTTAEERRADAALDSIQEKRAAHSAKRLADLAAEAYDVVKDTAWGLSAYRQDLRAILHAMQVIQKLEYTGEER